MSYTTSSHRDQSKGSSAYAEATAPNLLALSSYTVSSDYFSPSSQLCPQRCIPPPPMDAMTVYSCTETEDSSTCSSISAVDEESTPSSPRSIFQCYWEQSNRGAFASQSSSAQLLPPFSSIHSRCENSTQTSNKKALPSNESMERPNTDTTINRRRRRIFSGIAATTTTMNCGQEQLQHQHEPSLPVNPVSAAARHWRAGNVRKTKSAPGLVSQPSLSCLRKRTNNNNAPRRGSTNSSSDSSVTFSNHVDVVIFERPKEIWAAEGWSAFFSG